MNIRDNSYVFMERVHKLYDSFFERIDNDKWKHLIENKEYCPSITRDEMSSLLLDFLSDNNNLPTEVWDFLDRYFLWSINENVPDIIIDRLFYDDDLPYDNFDKDYRVDYDKYTILRRKSNENLKDGNLDEAYDNYIKAKEIYPYDVELEKIFILYNIENKNYSKALELYDKLKLTINEKETLKKDFHLLSQIAYSYIQLGKLYQAKKIYDDMAYVYPANEYIYQERFKVNRQIIDKLNIQLKESKKNNLEIIYEIALLYYQNKDYKKCYYILLKSTFKYRLTYEMYILKGKALRNFESIGAIGIKMAILSFNRTFKLADKEGLNLYEVLLWRGITHFDNGNLKKAKIDLEKASKYKPLDPEFYYIFGTLYSYTKEYKKGLDMYDKAINLKPFELKYYYVRANIHYDFKDYTSSIDDFQFIIDNLKDIFYLENEDINQSRPAVLHFILNLPEVWCQKGTCYLELRQYDDAIECFNKAICEDDRLEPINDKTFYRLALTYYKIKNYNMALKSLNKCTKLKFKDLKANSLDGIYILERDRKVKNELRVLKLKQKIFKDTLQNEEYFKTFVRLNTLKFLNWAFIKEKLTNYLYIFSVILAIIMLAMMFFKTGEIPLF